MTCDASRSQRLGQQLFDWLVAYARQQGCAALHLDSGVQRDAAHRFYYRQGMQLSCHHFDLAL